jgi:hypothetical protein
VVVMPLTWGYISSMIAPSRILARGPSGLRQSTVNPALTPPRATAQSARPGCLLPSGFLVDAALLVVADVSRVREASRSDGVAALEAVGAAWTMSARDQPPNPRTPAPSVATIVVTVYELHRWAAADRPGGDHWRSSSSVASRRPSATPARQACSAQVRRLLQFCSTLTSQRDRVVSI